MDEQLAQIEEVHTKLVTGQEQETISEHMPYEF